MHGKELLPHCTTRTITYKQRNSAGFCNLHMYLEMHTRSFNNLRLQYDEVNC
jgi:hypothetical protein